jgi:hypothetical protein
MQTVMGVIFIAWMAICYVVMVVQLHFKMWDLLPEGD